MRLQGNSEVSPEMWTLWALVQGPRPQRGRVHKVVVFEYMLLYFTEAICAHGRFQIICKVGG
jgi:hypothetical protein